MAFTLVLVSFSCTGPIIGTLLVEAATSGSIIAPAIGMLGFALALAIPFVLFAIFPSWLSTMPKSGGWLNSVKVVLGFLELALALKFLSVADLAYGWGILDRECFCTLDVILPLSLSLGKSGSGRQRVAHSIPLFSHHLAPFHLYDPACGGALKGIRISPSSNTRSISGGCMRNPRMRPPSTARQQNNAPDIFRLRLRQLAADEHGRTDHGELCDNEYIWSLTGTTATTPRDASR